MFLTKQFVHEWPPCVATVTIIDPAAVCTCMQTNFTVHGQPPQFLIASAANDVVAVSQPILKLYKHPMKYMLICEATNY